MQPRSRPMGGRATAAFLGDNGSYDGPFQDCTRRREFLEQPTACRQINAPQSGLKPRIPDQPRTVGALLFEIIREMIRRVEDRLDTRRGFTPAALAGATHFPQRFCPWSSPECRDSG